MKTEKISDLKYKLLIRNQKAIIISDKDNDKKQEQLLKEVEKKGKSVEEQRNKLIRKSLLDSIRINPQEVKQHFLSKGELENYRKSDKLNSDNPSIVVKKVKNELTFFGAAFLEGFLEVYGMKIDAAVKNYENKLHIIEEQSNNQQSIYIGRVKGGKLERITPNIKDKKTAHQELDVFIKRHKTKKQQQMLIERKEIEKDE